MTNAEKRVLLNYAQIEAVDMIALRDKMMRLRSKILNTIRKVVKDDPSVFKGTNDGVMDWMMDKMKRGYFGTDIRTEQLPSHLVAMQEVLHKA